MTSIQKILQQTGSSANDRVGMWISLINEVNPKRFAEVGVWKGDFAAAILEHCPCIETYYLIDPWANLPDWNKPFNVTNEQFNDIYEEALARTEFAANKRQVLRGRTKEVVDQIPDGSLDFAYIDGDHTLRGVATDLIKMLPKISDQGLLAGDDFSADPWCHGDQYEPNLVCPFAVYFAEAVDLPIYSLPHSQFVIEKSEAGFAFHDTVQQHQDLSIKPNTKTIASRLKSAVRRITRR